MTRNIEKLIGPRLIGGIFVPAVSSAAMALSANERDLKPAISLLLRDDIISWYVMRSTPRSDQEIVQLEQQLSKMIEQNISSVHGRIRNCTPENKNDGTKRDAIDLNVKNLVTMSTCQDNLASMPLSYQAWL